jgi:hypothetical protein
VQEPFARAQFIEMTKDEKLAAPAFERMNAGVRIGAAELSAGPGVEISTDYTTLIWDDSLGTAVPDQPYTMKAALLADLATIGPAAKAAGARSNGDRFKGPARPAQVTSLKFVIASTDDQAPAPVPGASAPNYTSAAAAMKTYLAANPQQRGKIQLLPVAG